ncbi:hypothetical protein [Methanobrevibacter olleyae]|uniref:hypothetical protein n=1 Tax=Methanobrevibacter olleyae TaxID=294671 RepID=UPI00117CAE22|nr:hypothetical protein [Methanobrevibacter olleyae]
MFFLNIIKENNISLSLSIISIIISLYTIYKTDEQLNKQINTSKELLLEELLFDKKQEAVLLLIKELDKYKTVIDTEYINSHDKEIYYNTLEEVEYFITNIVNFIHNIKFSLHFNYYSKEVQELIDKFIDYSNEHFDKEYFEMSDTPFKDNKDYIESLDLLKEIYNNLKKEIGKTV